MSKSWTWIAPYIFAILTVLLAGPLLSNLALIQSVSVPYLQLSGPHLWILAFSAFQQIPDNGRGSSFLRNLVLPLTTLVVILFINKTFKAVGLPLIEQIGSSRFAWIYAIGLVGSGLWLTVAWILNRDSLREAFAPRRHTQQQEAHALAVNEDSRQ
jgi:serine/threonine-protein kinase